MIQLDFFKEPPTEVEILREEIAEVRAANDRVRKGIFARHNELFKMYLELKEEHESWKETVCKGENNVRILHN